MTKRRIPTAQKVNEGDKSKVGKHVLWQKLESEPRAAHGLPGAPAHLNARARAAWNFWREQLESMNLDHACDAVALEACCMAYARGVEAELTVSREGAIIDEPILYKGVPIPGEFRKKRHPASIVAAANWQLLKIFVVEFGLTPVARTRLTVEPRRQDAGDQLRELLDGPRLTADERRRLQ